MKTVRILVAVAALAFVSGFWAACSIGFDVTDDANKFSCNVDQDCIAPYRCLGSVCTRGSVANCTDKDEDGYGVGETGECPKCVSEGRCEEDCNDNDEAINPGLLDNCDGKDNNCDEQIDEAIPCEDSFDCPDEQPYLPSCDAGSCVYRVPLQQGAECSGSNAIVGCVGAKREDRPDSCF